MPARISFFLLPSPAHSFLILAVFIQKMNSTGTLVLPSKIRYGIGLPDTYPQDLSAFGHKKLKLITLRSVSVLDPVSGEKYTCDIIAHFTLVDKESRVLQEMVERQLIGVQSLECAGKGEEMRDIVRQKMTAKKEKRVKLGGY